MSEVDDHGLEVIKKSAEYTDPTSPTKKKDYYLKVGAFGPFQIPLTADAITASYPDSITEVYEYRSGGVSGTILKTVTVIYTSSSKDLISSVEET